MGGAVDGAAVGEGSRLQKPSRPRSEVRFWCKFACHGKDYVSLWQELPEDTAKPNDAKPNDAKPNDAKPNDAKPNDAKPMQAKDGI